MEKPIDSVLPGVSLAQYERRSEFDSMTPARVRYLLVGRWHHSNDNNGTAREEVAALRAELQNCLQAMDDVDQDIAEQTSYTALGNKEQREIVRLLDLQKILRQDRREIEERLAAAQTALDRRREPVDILSARCALLALFMNASSVKPGGKDVEKEDET